MLYWELVCVKAILLYSELIWVKDIMLYSVPKSVPAFVRPGFDNKQTWNERKEFSLCKHYIRINLLCHPGGKPRRRIYKQKKNEFKSWTEPVKLYYRPKLFVVILGLGCTIRKHFLTDIELANFSPLSAVAAHMGPEGPSNFIKKLKGSVLAIFFFVVT